MASACRTLLTRNAHTPTQSRVFTTRGLVALLIFLNRTIKLSFIVLSDNVESDLVRTSLRVVFILIFGLMSAIELFKAVFLALLLLEIQTRSHDAT